MQTFNAEFHMTAALETGMKKSIITFTAMCVSELATKYNFDADEAMTYLNLDDMNRYVKKTKATKTKKSDASGEKVKKASKKVEKPSIYLPWCGTANDDWCQAIRPNRGLYTQCTNAPVDEWSEFCKTCQGQMDKSGDDAPKNGHVKDRVERGDEWRDPKGKAPTHYGNIMKKLGYTQEQVKEEAAKWGFEVDESCFVEKKGKRGRPKKNTASASDTDESGSDSSGSKSSKKRGRGRPKKVKASENSDMADEVIRKAMEEAKMDKPKPKPKVAPKPNMKRAGNKKKVVFKEKPKPEEELEGEEFIAEAGSPAGGPIAKCAPTPTEFSMGVPISDIEDCSDDEDDEVQVKEIDIHGDMYLIDGNNMVYDIETHDPIGIYDGVNIMRMDDE